MPVLVNHLPPVAAADDLWLDGNLGTAGDVGRMVLVGSEKMLVLYGLGTSHLFVERAVDGTTIAHHVAGDAVTTSTALGGGGGGGVTADNTVDLPAVIANLIIPGASVSGDTADMTGVLQVRQIGPYTVNFDTPNIADGADLVALDDEVIVVRAWARFATAWNSGTEASFWIMIGEAGAHNGGLTIAQYDALVVVTFDFGFGWQESGLIPTPIVGIAGTDAALVVQVAEDGSPATAGSADVYALIAVP